MMYTAFRQMDPTLDAGADFSAEYAIAMGMDERTARRHLNQFFKLGLVRKTGSGPSTEYQIK